MRTTVNVRPEQACYLLKLQSEVEAAKNVHTAALNAAIAGMFDSTCTVVGIAEDGTVTVELPDEEDT